MEMNHTADIGIIGGSGLYDIEGFEAQGEAFIETPFGKPSDAIMVGRYGTQNVAFLPRHGRGHRLLPTELNHRANIWALRSLNVRWIIAVTAVGSLQEKYHPRDILLPDQFFDRTSRRDQHTFFGGGIVAHVSFGDPISTGLREILNTEVSALNYRVHNGGTYVCMDGPAFSTRAESNAHRQLGFDVIGMTNLPEAKLAREAEIALATLAMVTDYDCWHPGHDAVTVDQVVAVVHKNASMAKAILKAAVEQFPVPRDCECESAARFAIMTAPHLIPEKTKKDLAPIIGRYLK